MTPGTEAFLAQVRDAEGPPAGAEARVLASVRAAVAPPPSASAGAASSLKAVLKLAVLIGGVAAASVTPPPARETAHPRIEARAPGPPPQAAEVAAAPAEAPGTPPPSPPRAEARERPRTRPPADLQAELALLAEVHAALRRGDGADALRRLDAHRTRDRQLAPERRAARVLALCAVGRHSDAQRAAAEFARRYPTAAQRTAVERACAGTPSE